jgi:hypothetical protein
MSALRLVRTNRVELAEHSFLQVSTLSLVSACSNDESSAFDDGPLHANDLGYGELSQQQD